MLLYSGPIHRLTFKPLHSFIPYTFFLKSTAFLLAIDSMGTEKLLASAKKQLDDIYASLFKGSSAFRFQDVEFTANTCRREPMETHDEMRPCFDHHRDYRLAPRDTG